MILKINLKKNNLKIFNRILLKFNKNIYFLKVLLRMKLKFYVIVMNDPIQTN